MSLTPEERLKDIFSETKHVLSPSRYLLEPLFRSSVRAESSRQHISIEEARKYKFQEILRELREEATSNSSNFGILERSSREFQNFLTAIHVIFTPEQIRKFKEDARPRFRIFRPFNGISETPTKEEIKDSEDFFQNKFKGYSLKQNKPEKSKPPKEQSHIPDAVLLSQHALESRNMRLIIERLLSEVDLTVAGARGDLRSILRRRPDIGADIGMILLIKEILDGIEHGQEIASSGQRVIQSTGRTIQETSVAHFTGDFYEIGKEIERSMGRTKKDYYWGPVSLIFLVPLRAAVPLIRGILSVPLGLIVGAKDAFVFTGHGNKRPRK